MSDLHQHYKNILAIACPLSSFAFLLALMVQADAQEKDRQGARSADGCEVRAQDEPGMLRISACLKCQPGYLMKGGGCRRAGDFGSGQRELRPKREPKPIQPMR